MEQNGDGDAAIPRGFQVSYGHGVMLNWETGHLRPAFEQLSVELAKFFPDLAPGKRARRRGQSGSLVVKPAQNRGRAAFGPDWAIGGLVSEGAASPGQIAEQERTTARGRFQRRQ